MQSNVEQFCRLFGAVGCGSASTLQLGEMAIALLVALVGGTWIVGRLFST